nr:acyl-CoA wax alcohol acyltransferase 2-like [Halyomorpha halys]
MKRQYSLMDRFLQNLAVAYYTTFIFGYVLVILLTYYILFHTNYWPILLLSLIWTWYDRETPHRGGRGSWIMKSLPFLKHMRDYFPVGLVKTAYLDPDKNYLFCMYPHGIVSASNFVNFVVEDSPRHELFPGCKFYSAASDFNFFVPFFRDFIMAQSVVAASSKSLRYILNDRNKGNVLNLILGGANEVRYVRRGQYKIILKKRKGFVKLALNEGCCLVPVINFGENDIYDLKRAKPGSFLYTLQQWFLKKTSVYLMIPVGRSGLFSFLPKREPMTTVVGRPIQLPKVNEPSSEQIEHYHSLFTEELIKLFNEHKHKYTEDPENTNLIIVE